MLTKTGKTIIYAVYTYRDNKITYFNNKDTARTFAWNELMTRWIQDTTPTNDILEAWSDLLLNDEIEDVVSITTETVIDDIEVKVQFLA